MSSPLIDVNTIFGFWPWRQVDISLDRLLVLAREHHITRVCAACAMGMFIDPQRGNEQTLQAAAEHSLLFPVGVLDVRCAPTARDVERWTRRGMRWFRFFPAQQWRLDDLVFQSLLDPLDEYGCVLQIPESMGLSDIARVADRYRNPIMVLGTGFSSGPQLDQLLDRSHVLADISKLNAIGQISWLAEQGHGDQLVFGSGMPLHYPASALGLLNDPIIDADLRRRIAHENALRLMEVAV